MKTLVLKPRMKTRWHDRAVMENALETIVHGRSLTKAAMWLEIAAKIEEAAELAELDKNPEAELQIELRDGQAKLLWQELARLPMEAFGRGATGQPVVVPLAPLEAMLREIAGALEGEMPEMEAGE
jgi:hypothetical protein